jgi:hypothetical protein
MAPWVSFQFPRLHDNCRRIRQKKKEEEEKIIIIIIIILIIIR